MGFFRNKTELVIRVVPLTYLRCQQLQPEFPGCLASIDHQEEQCATGREGVCVCVCVCVYCCVCIKCAGLHTGFGPGGQVTMLRLSFRELGGVSLWYCEDV